VLVAVLGLLWDGYDPIRDTQSELGALDSPYRLVMNLAGFMGLGVSILTFAAAYYLLLAPSAAKVLATGLLAIAGLGMVVVGFANPSDAVARSVEVDAPAGFERYFERLAEAVPAGSRLDPVTMAALQAEHDTHPPPA
jgi:hypothetical protein